MDAAVKLLREKGIASAGKRAGAGHRRGRRSRPTSTPAARSARWSRSAARPTSSPATTTSRRSPARWPCRSRPAAHLRVVSEDEMSDEFRASELEIFRAKAAAEGKPEAMLDKIADGMWKKSLTDYVLLNQPRSGPRTTARRSRRCAPSCPARSARTSRSSASRASRWARSERTRRRPAFRRVLLKLSGEALMGDRDYGQDPERHRGPIARRRSHEVRRMGVEDGDRRRRRQHPARHPGGGPRHGPGDRRLRRHAGHAC